MPVCLPPGKSRAADIVRDNLKRTRTELHTSAALGMETVIREQLADVWDECSHPGWDGYGSLPITWDAYNNAEQFLLALPLGVRAPSVGAEPNGFVVFEWHRAPRRVLSVSVTPNDELHYAVLLGPRRMCGTEPFFGEVPANILNLIGEVYSC